MSLVKQLDNTTLIVPVLNASFQLKQLLDEYNSIFKAVIVVDSISKEDIKSVCLNYRNVYYCQREYDTSANQKNFALQFVNTEWVFFLDVDERLSPEIIDFIKENESNNEVDLVFFSRRNLFLDHDLGHSSGYPDFQGRWFKKAYIKWDNKEVHAKPVYINKAIEPKPFKYVKIDIIHDDYKGLDIWWKRNERYLKYDLIEYNKKGVKWSLFKQVFFPFFIFIKLYFLKGLFRFGIKGFFVAFSEASYYFFSYWQLYELKYRK